LEFYHDKAEPVQKATQEICQKEFTKEDFFLFIGMLNKGGLSIHFDVHSQYQYHYHIVSL